MKKKTKNKTALMVKGACLSSTVNMFKNNIPSCSIHELLAHALFNVYTIGNKQLFFLYYLHVYFFIFLLCFSFTLYIII